jgi:stage II sporulation protein AA (anti-sigma F factor antagonist)
MPEATSSQRMFHAQEEPDVLTPEVGGPIPSVVSSELLSEHGAIVLVDGDLDMETAPQLERHLADRIAHGHRHLVLDLTGATFLDSTALRVLLTTIAPLQDEADAAVVLAGTHGIVERALTTSGIGPMFTSFPTRPEAVAALTESAEPLCEGWRAVRRRPE